MDGGFNNGSGVPRAGPEVERLAAMAGKYKVYLVMGVIERDGYTLYCTGVMENIVKNGVVLKLPPGFRFHPIDEELVVQYLARKIFSMPLPAAIIPEVEVCKSDPWDLPGDKEQTRYFFSSREAKYPNGSRSNRATGSGYWKATGIDRKIMSSGRNQVCGLKKTLVFYQGKPNKGFRTNWIMHEYRVDSSLGEAIIRRSAAYHATLAAQMEKWVICRVFLKKRGGKDGEQEQQQQQSKTDMAAVLRAHARPILCDLNEAPTSSSCGLKKPQVEV